MTAMIVNDRSAISRPRRNFPSLGDGGAFWRPDEPFWRRLQSRGPGASVISGRVCAQP